MGGGVCRECGVSGRDAALGQCRSILGCGAVVSHRREEMFDWRAKRWEAKRFRSLWRCGCDAALGQCRSRIAWEIPSFF